MSGAIPQQGIMLGGYLDDLLNRKAVGGYPPHGILLPHGDDPWSGNIVICGQAGSGKSTLALQIARACTSNQNRFAAGYISLEEGSEGVMRKATGFGWRENLRVARHLHWVEDAASPEKLAFRMADILTKPQAENCLLEQASEWKSGPMPPPKCPGRAAHDRQFPPRKKQGESIRHLRVGEWSHLVWLFELSPTALVTAREQGALFQERYRQMEHLLGAASALNQNAGKGKSLLPLVCVDSLNVFGSHEPVREEYHRLFDLFHRHGIVGVFTVEAGRDTPFDSTMADVVIRLTEEEDQGYFIRYMEVEKSRYIPQAYGRHTFKII